MKRLIFSLVLALGLAIVLVVNAASVEKKDDQWVNKTGYKYCEDVIEGVKNLDTFLAWERHEGEGFCAYFIDSNALALYILDVDEGQGNKTQIKVVNTAHILHKSEYSNWFCYTKYPFTVYALVEKAGQKAGNKSEDTKVFKKAEKAVKAAFPGCIPCEKVK